MFKKLKEQLKKPRTKTYPDINIKPKEKIMAIKNNTEKDETKAYDVKEWARTYLDCAKPVEEKMAIAEKVERYLAEEALEPNLENCFIAYQQIVNGMY